MAKKIEIIGQALVITDTVASKVLFEAPKGEYYYHVKTLVNNGKIKFYNIDHEDNAVARPPIVDLSEAIDSGDVAFTESSFQTFARENLGFKTASGGSGAVGTLQQVTDQGATTSTNTGFLGNLAVGAAATPFGAKFGVDLGTLAGSGAFMAVNSVDFEPTSGSGNMWGWSNLIDIVDGVPYQSVRGTYNRVRAQGNGIDFALADYNETIVNPVQAGSTFNLVASNDSYVRQQGSVAHTIDFAVGSRGSLVMENPNAVVDQGYSGSFQTQVTEGTLNTLYGVFISVNQGGSATIGGGQMLHFTGSIDTVAGRTNDVKVINSLVDLPSFLTGEIEAKFFKTTGGLTTDVVKGDGSLEHRADAAGTGWQYITDGTYTEASPLVIPQGNTQDISLDGATNITSQLPAGVTTFYDLTNGIITPENVGDGYTFSIGFNAKSSSNNGDIKIGIDIGGAIGKIFPGVIRLPRGIGIAHELYITMQGYSLNTFVANGGQIIIESGTGQTEIYDLVLQIHRTHKAR